jgi:S-formylglutathione hydrolase
MKILKTHKCFDGLTQFWEHESPTTKTTMKFSTFTPVGEVKGCLLWLSGLTCTEENFMVKSGAQKYLAENNLMVICPDTSPRGLDLPHEHESWDFGSAASFYVNSKTEGYKNYYQMYDYITKDIYDIIQNHFKMKSISIFGHSMGGHGALMIGLRNAEKFKSISAFSPIVNPMKCPWGQKAFRGYLGNDEKAWTEYDTCELIRSGKTHPQKILVDQGTEDTFLEKELLTSNLVNVLKESSQKADVRFQNGYDHSFYFISTFIKEHIEFHARLM